MNANRKRSLWTCPMCGANLVSNNLWHSYGKATLDEEVQAWLRESYRLMGMQERLKESGRD